MNWKRILHFVLLLAVSWCVMTFTHELGHVIGGTCCGGRLVDADLWPWHLPYTIFEPDPLPLLTLWAGPVLGVLLPLLAAYIADRQAAWFVAWFCILANGLYLATAWVSGDKQLDTPKLLAKGTPPSIVVTYCVATIVPGYLGFRKSCIDFFKTEPLPN